MDTAVVVLLIILVIIFGIFFISISGSGSTTGQAVSGANSYPSQQGAGGGCGR